MENTKPKSKEIMIVLRNLEGFVLKAARVMVPAFGEPDFNIEIRSRQGFTNREHKRREKGTRANYIVHHDARDYDSFQGGWERCCQAIDGYPPQRSTDPNFIRIHNALIPYPTYQGIFEFYKEIGFDHKRNKFAPDSYTARLENDDEFRRTEFHRASFNARS